MKQIKKQKIIAKYSDMIVPKNIWFSLKKKAHYKVNRRGFWFYAFPKEYFEIWRSNDYLATIDYLANQQNIFLTEAQMKSLAARVEKWFENNKYFKSVIIEYSYTK